MTVATLNNCTETRPHHYVAEASDMGLPPGEWPTAIITYLGNRQPFVFERAEHDAEGELRAVHYNQQLGCVTLTVYND